MFALKRTSLGSGLDCVAPCLEESLLSLAKLRLEEVWKSFTEHTKPGFISHHVGEPAYCWWSTDTDVSVEAMGTQQTLCPW